MAINSSPIPVPSQTKMLDENGLVTNQWRDFFQFSVDYMQPRWRDINLGGIALTLAASGQPDKVKIDSTNILVYAFDGGAATEELHGNFELQHDYQEGRPLYPHLHWYPTDTNTGNVKWQLEYYIKNGTTKTTGTSSVVSAASGVAWEETFAEFTEISGTGMEIASQIHFRLFRIPTDALDTYAHDAAIATIGIHYKVDYLGSSNKSSK